MIYQATPSPVGLLTLATDDTHLTALHIEGDRYFTAIPDDWQMSPDNPLLIEAGRQLAEYFAGTRRTFELPLRPTGTDFQQSVWQALTRIAPGTTTTYGELAESLGRPNAARAVGTAVGRNPVCILIPCHRVLPAGGSLGGYVAGLACKQQLLGLEGGYLQA